MRQRQRDQTWPTIASIITQLFSRDEVDDGMSTGDFYRLIPPLGNFAGLL